MSYFSSNLFQDKYKSYSFTRSIIMLNAFLRYAVSLVLRNILSLRSVLSTSHSMLSGSLFIILPNQQSGKTVFTKWDTLGDISTVRICYFLQLVNLYPLMVEQGTAIFAIGLHMDCKHGYLPKMSFIPLTNGGA